MYVLTSKGTHSHAICVRTIDLKGNCIGFGVVGIDSAIVV